MRRERNLGIPCFKVIQIGYYLHFYTNFRKDGTLGKPYNHSQLELRMMLDDPIAQRALGLFAKERKALDIFMCWVDTHEYKSIPTPDYRRSKALHIYHKYIKTDSILEIGGIPNSERDRIKALLEESKDDPTLLQTDLFDKAQVRDLTLILIRHNSISLGIMELL